MSNKQSKNRPHFHIGPFFLSNTAKYLTYLTRHCPPVGPPAAAMPRLGPKRPTADGAASPHNYCTDAQSCFFIQVIPSARVAQDRDLRDV